MKRMLALLAFLVSNSFPCSLKINSSQNIIKHNQNTYYHYMLILMIIPLF